MVLAISRGNLHKYISELVSSGLSCLPIKAHLQERFSECSSVTVAKHKLTQLRQSELPMDKYITKLGDMAEHAYSIKATNSAMLFWPQISLRVYKTLMSKQVKVLSCQEPERHI